MGNLRRSINGAVVCCLVAMFAAPGAATAETFPATQPTYNSEFGASGTAKLKLFEPNGTAVDASGNVWVVDTGNNRLEEFTSAGVLIRTVGAKGKGEGKFDYPQGIAINKLAGDLYVVDTDNNRVEEFSTSTGGFIRSFGTLGAGNGQLRTPSYVAVDPTGDVWVTDSENFRLEEFSATGTFIAISTGGAGKLSTPGAIAFGHGGQLYVVDQQRIVVLTAAGAYLRQFALPTGAVDIAADPRTGALFVTTETHVQSISSSGTVLGQFGSDGAGPGQFYDPAGIAIDSFGDIYVVDRGSPYRVERWVLPTPSTGQTGWYSLEEANGSSAMTAGVNVAGGNVLITQQDLAAEEGGTGVALSRIYNSQSVPAAGTLGPHWSWSAGPDVYLLDEGETIVLHGPSGDVVTFVREPSGAYVAPEEFEGTLSRNGDGTYQLAHAEHMTYVFNSTGEMTSGENEESKLVTVGDTTSAWGPTLHSLAPPAGTPLEVAYDGFPHVSSVTYPAGYARRYEYNGLGQLSRYTDAEGGVTTYEYDTNGYISKVTLPGGSIVSITTVAGKAAEMSVTSATEGQYSEKFLYEAPVSPTCNPASDAGETVVTKTIAEGGVQPTETYCYNAQGEITGFNGPGSEAPPTEPGEEPQELVPAGTCSRDEESSGETYCGQEDPPGENEQAPGSFQQQLQPQATGIPDLAAARYGIADNNALASYNYFTFEYFKKLKLASVRRTVPWDLVTQATYPGPYQGAAKGELADVKKWVEEVEVLDNKTGVPVLTFDHCHDNETAVDPTNPTGPGIPCTSAPNRAQYKAAVKAVLADPVLGTVKHFTAWNEPNLPTEPVSSNPKLAGSYWATLDAMCAPPKPGEAARCIVAAGDFLDSEMHNADNKNGPGGKFFNEYFKGMEHGQTAGHWAWHAYSDGEQTWTRFHNRSSSEWWESFHHFSAAIDHKSGKTPDVWLTEQGVRFSDNHKPLVGFHNGHRAAAVMRAYVQHGFQQLTRQSPHITYFYYYETRGEPFSSGNQDSGLVPPKGSGTAPRNIYYIYREKTAP